ncbi:MAG: 3-phosphoshikimate 1-carboxyvinyltransferase, partial [Thermoleophilia bacterium]|nr:3-phosphoshikimate 1-carboxyvinyltransferase [Thermoleophilia bacterium]
LLVGTGAEYLILDGDDGLRARPMARVATPLRRMGASVFTAPGGTPPLVVNGGRPLRGTRHELPAASADAKDCLLLAGLYADGETWVAEPAPSRDHAERLLAAAGVEILRDGGAVGVRGPVNGLSLPDLRVPGDFGAAAFHLVAGALLGDPEVRLEGVDLDPRRTGLLDVMRRMGAEVAVEEGDPVAGAPCGTLVVRRADALRGTVVAPEEVPALVDELPLVGLLAAMAHGATEVRGAGGPGEQERLATGVGALRAMGVDAEELEDGFRVTGAGAIPGGEIASLHDHRFAMLGAVAGLASTDGVAVHGFEACQASYPGFARDLAALGAV